MLLSIHLYLLRLIQISANNKRYFSWLVFLVVVGGTDLNGAIWIYLHPPVAIGAKDALSLTVLGRTVDVGTPLSIIWLNLFKAIE